MQDSNSNKLESRLHQPLRLFAKSLALHAACFKAVLSVALSFFLQDADLFMQNLSAESEKLCDPPWTIAVPSHSVFQS